MAEELTTIFQDPRIVQATATATSGTGFTTALGIIPDVIGIVASVFGITITFILWIKQKRKLDLEIVLLKEKIENEKL